MKHGSLFSGIGGFDLAAEWMGWENIFHCEWNPFCQKILKQHFPNAIGYGDITKTDFSEWKGKIDIVSGGFPCQPYSAAGKRKGKDDERHLWPEMLRAIREIQPSWIVGENVSGLLNWKRGMVLAEIKADLESAGFEVFPPCVLPACGKNAPHRRDRVWIVAHSKMCNARGIKPKYSKQQNGKEKREGLRNKFGSNGFSGTIANTDSQIGCKGWVYPEGQQEAKRHIGPCNSRNVTNSESRRLQKRDAEQLGESEPDTNVKQFSGLREWENFPTQSPIRIRDDGLSGELDGITISQLRTKSIEAAGNAIVPQVAFEIFKAIQQTENIF